MKADVLSRLINLEGEEDNKQVEMLKPEWFIRRVHTKDEEATPNNIILLRAELFQIRGGEDILSQIRKTG